jgi:hypothetical protein
VEGTLIGNTLEETAYHEAGHMVGAAVSGLDLKTNGIIVYEVGELADGWAFYWEDKPLWDSILLAVRAGQVAQLRKFPNSEFRGGQQDVKNFFDVVTSQFGQNRCGEFWERISSEVNRLLNEHWPAVEKIAKALMQSDWVPVEPGEHPVARRKKVLDGNALVAVLARHDISAVSRREMAHMRRVVIVGVDHFLQNLEPLCVTPEGKRSEVRQKAALKARLEEMISYHRPQLIGEEEKPRVGSVGKELADAHNLKYCTLTMPWEAREKAGIARDYRTTRQTKRAAYETFESFMFDRIRQNRGDSTSILVICGSDHMERLAKRFHMAGDKTWAEDTYYASWYEGRPKESGGEVLGYDKDRPDV